MSSVTESGSGQDGSENLLSADEAKARILATVSPLEGHETVELRSARGRVLAEDLISPIDVPAHDNAAMDGYAVRSEDLRRELPTELQVVGRVLAGHPVAGPFAPGQCVQIMTGAEVPEGLDTIIEKELCVQQGQVVTVPADIRAGRNLRRAGEDLARGLPALSAGSRLGAAELGLIASLGLNRVPVFRKPRVLYFSTGDEIRNPGETSGPGQIYDSNRYTVTAMLEDMGLEVISPGIIPDQPEALETVIRQAAQQADLILSSGGVSVGDADYVGAMLNRTGEVGFWKLAIKPGRPLAFGRVGKAWFFGLPGNPVATMVSFLQFVKPALRKMMGEGDWSPFQLQLPAGESLKSRIGRTEYLRGVIEKNSAGELSVRSTGQQGSGILTSMSRADCLIVLGPESGDIVRGQLVTVQPLQGLL